MTPGIHLAHKPVGPTSFSLVRHFMKTAPPTPGGRPARICHGGTLDPFASGLLLILVEPATRLFDYLHDIPKTYRATVRWGVETDNGDPHGQVTFTGNSSALSPQQLDDALATFIGWREQIPHPTSAKRIEGERAYLKAHRGETVIMPPSRVYLHEARWLRHDLPEKSQLQMTVRGGYYVRALARDLGKLLGCGAHLSELHRAAIGPWTDPGPQESIALHGPGILPWAPTRILTDQEVGDLRLENTIPLGELLPPQWSVPEGFPTPQPPVRGFHQERFCFLLAPQGDQLRLLRPLRGGI
ncbi:MAG: tRNA pseudouridine(55) synthase TruB [Tepidisphaeraceae bacterium]|jgi:tRNA pseudouridine55 synthase